MTLISKILALVFGGSVASVSPSPGGKPASIDEILTYECAKHVISLAPALRQIGPVFQSLGLVMTSITSSGGGKILIVNAGAGHYSMPLLSSGVNRIRFSVPSGALGEMKSYFVSYSHGGSRDSRLYDLTVDRPPVGRDEIDYQSVQVRRADGLLSYVDYAIFETIENTLNMITDKKIQGRELSILKPETCDHISRTSPSLARILRYDLDLIKVIIKGPSSSGAGGNARVPASLASRLPH